MSSLKLPKEESPQGFHFYSLRLWQQDFYDIISLLTQAGCVLRIDDRDRDYTSVEDYFNDAPHEIDNIRLIGYSSNYDLSKENGLRVYISANRTFVYYDVSGDKSQADSLAKNLKFLFDRKQKRFARSVRSIWLSLAIFPIWFAMIVPTDLIVYYAQKSRIGSWEVFIINAGIMIALAFMQERFQKSVRNTDLWFRKTPTIDTYWSRNRDRLITDTIRGLIVAAVIGGVVAPLGFIVKQLILNHQP